MVTTDDDDPSLMQRAQLKLDQLLVETQVAREESFRSQMGRMLKAGRTQNLVLGFVANVGTAIAGLAGYLLLPNPWNFGAAVFGLLGVIGILAWVLRL